MDQAHTLEDEQVVNDVSLEFATMIRDEVKSQPEFAEGRWRVRSEWVGQTTSEARVTDSHIGGDNVKRDFSIKMDQPHELCGGNQFASPQEHLLAALAGCFISNFAVVSALRNITLHKLGVEISGDTDMSGLFDLSNGEDAGFSNVQFVVSVSANAPIEDIKSVYDHVCQISPNLGGMGNANLVSTELDILPE